MLLWKGYSQNAAALLFNVHYQVIKAKVCKYLLDDVSSMLNSHAVGKVQCYLGAYLAIFVPPQEHFLQLHYCHSIVHWSYVVESYGCLFADCLCTMCVVFR